MQDFPNQDKAIVVYLLERLDRSETTPRDAAAIIIELALRTLAWSEPGEGVGFNRKTAPNEAQQRAEDQQDAVYFATVGRVGTNLRMGIVLNPHERGPKYERVLDLRVFRGRTERTWTVELIDEQPQKIDGGDGLTKFCAQLFARLTNGLATYAPSRTSPG